MNGKLIIIEGIDRVGKTTLAKMLEDAGFTYFKDTWNLVPPNHHNNLFSAGKLDTTITTLKMMLNAGMNVVIDRFYMTEIAYTIAEERQGHKTIAPIQYDIEDILVDYDPLLVYVTPLDKKLSFELANQDQTAHLDVFEKMVGSTKLRAVRTSWGVLKSTAMAIMANEFDYDFYLAAPWFNEEMADREERVKNRLRNLGYSVFSPKEMTSIKPDADNTSQKKAFADNVTGIDRCASIIAITDMKDMGTIWESGYAFGTSKPIVYYAETLGNRPFNLMLAQSGKKVITDEDGLSNMNYYEVLFEGASGFKGLIE